MEAVQQTPKGWGWVDLITLVALPAFLAGAGVMFAAVWFGPVDLRDRIISQYQTDTQRLAGELTEAQRVQPIEAVELVNMSTLTDQNSPVQLQAVGLPCRYFGKVIGFADRPEKVALAIESKACTSKDGAIVKRPFTAQIDVSRSGSPIPVGARFSIPREGAD